MSLFWKKYGFHVFYIGTILVIAGAVVLGYLQLQREIAFLLQDSPNYREYRTQELIGDVKKSIGLVETPDSSQGTAWLTEHNGRIVALTSYHLVRDSLELNSRNPILIKFPNRSPEKFFLIDVDTAGKNDLAILGPIKERFLPNSLPIRQDTSDLLAGETVIGFSYYYSTFMVSVGTIQQPSSKNSYIFADINLAPGGSGGALISVKDGCLVGQNTAFMNLVGTRTMVAVKSKYVLDFLRRSERKIEKFYTTRKEMIATR